MKRKKRWKALMLHSDASVITWTSAAETDVSVAAYSAAPWPDCGEKLRHRPRAPASRSAMRPHMVVVASPIFQRQTGVHQRREQGLVQKLVTQTAVEAFDEGVLHWLAWCDVVPADVGLVGPAQNGIAGQLRAVVADDSLGPAAGADQKIKLSRDPLAGQRSIHHGSQTLAGAVVENR
jgi:hypothetical protein